MSKFSMAGCYVANITPFKDGLVDVPALERLVENQIANGTAGIVPVGTTGESPSLTDEEYRLVVSTVVKAAAGKCKVIAGAGANNTLAAVKKTQLAKELGADAVLSVNPYYNKPTQKGHIAHFTEINKVGIPIVLYNIPGRCGGAGMTVETIKEVAKLENVVALKEATGNVDFTSAILSECPDLQILSGDDSLTLPLMSVGATGVISVVANIWPGKMAALVKSVQDGELETARQHHSELYKLCKAMFCETNPIPVKAAGAFMGLWQAEARLPITPLEDENVAPLKAALVSAKLL